MQLHERGVRALTSPLAGRLYGRAPRLGDLAARALARAIRGANASASAEAERNLRTAFPGWSAETCRDTARASVESQIRADLTVRTLRTLTRDGIARLCAREVSVHGIEHLEEVAGRGSPSVIFSPHYGEFVIGIIRVALELVGRKEVHLFFDSPGRNPANEGFKDLFEKACPNLRVIYNDRFAVRHALKALRAGQVLVMQPDVYDVRGAVHYVPLFGRLTVAMAGTGFFALHGGAPLVPAFCFRDGARRWSLRVDPPLEPVRGGDAEQDVYDTTALIWRAIERQLHTRPEPWMYWATLHQNFAHDVTLPDLDAGWEPLLSALAGRDGMRTPQVEALLGLMREPLPDR